MTSETCVTMTTESSSCTRTCPMGRQRLSVSTSGVETHAYISVVPYRPRCGNAVDCVAFPQNQKCAMWIRPWCILRSVTSIQKRYKKQRRANCNAMQQFLCVWRGHGNTHSWCQFSETLLVFTDRPSEAFNYFLHQKTFNIQTKHNLSHHKIIAKELNRIDDVIIFCLFRGSHLDESHAGRRGAGL